MKASLAEYEKRAKGEKETLDKIAKLESELAALKAKESDNSNKEREKGEQNKEEKAKAERLEAHNRNLVSEIETLKKLSEVLKAENERFEKEGKTKVTLTSLIVYPRGLPFSVHLVRPT